MSRSPLDIEDLVEHWTLLPDELDLVEHLHEPSRLLFAMGLKFYTRHGRFPRGRGEHDEGLATSEGEAVPAGRGERDARYVLLERVRRRRHQAAIPRAGSTG